MAKPKKDEGPQGLDLAASRIDGAVQDIEALNVGDKRSGALDNAVTHLRKAAEICRQQAPKYDGGEEESVPA